MSLLTDTDIRAILCDSETWENPKESLRIFPFSEQSLTPVGYDLRVGDTYASSIDAERYELREGDVVTIRPGDTVLITTEESVDMPQSSVLSAFITSKVSKVSMGLSHISTNVDPDWQGNLLIAMHNPSVVTLKLKQGETFCTINFIKNLSPSTKSSKKPPGRTDLLLEAFVENLRKEKAERQIEEHRSEKSKRIWNRCVLTLQFLIIIGGGLTGLYVFGNNPGFIASTALGVGVATVLQGLRKP